MGPSAQWLLHRSRRCARHRFLLCTSPPFYPRLWAPGHSNPSPLAISFNPALPDNWHPPNPAGSPASAAVSEAVTCSSHPSSSSPPPPPPVPPSHRSRLPSRRQLRCPAGRRRCVKPLWSYAALHAYSGPLYTLPFRQLPRLHHDATSWSALARLMGAASIELQPGQGRCEWAGAWLPCTCHLRYHGAIGIDCVSFHGPMRRLLYFVIGSNVPRRVLKGWLLCFSVCAAGARTRLRGLALGVDGTGAGAGAGIRGRGGGTAGGGPSGAGTEQVGLTGCRAERVSLQLPLTRLLPHRPLPLQEPLPGSVLRPWLAIPLTLSLPSSCRCTWPPPCAASMAWPSAQRCCPPTAARWTRRTPPWATRRPACAAWSSTAGGGPFTWTRRTPHSGPRWSRRRANEGKHGLAAWGSGAGGGRGQRGGRGGRCRTFLAITHRLLMKRMVHVAPLCY